MTIVLFPALLCGSDNHKHAPGYKVVEIRGLLLDRGIYPELCRYDPETGSMAI